MNKVSNNRRLSIRERLAFVLRGEVPLDRRTANWRRPSDHEESGIEYMDVDSLWHAIKHAEDGHIDDLYAIYRDMIAGDGHIQTEFAKRKLALLGDAQAVQPCDEGTPEDVAAADAIRDMLAGVHGWERVVAHLLESTLYPVAVVEKVFRRARRPGLDYELAQLVPVPHDLIDLTTGRLRIHDTDPETGSRLQTSHPCDPERYIVHRGHILSLPDQWGGPMRSILFWGLLSTMDRTWWANFLDKYGTPFPVGKYDQDDDASRSILASAFAAAKRLGGLVVSKETDVELVEASRSDAGDAFEKFHNICQREKSKLILGQTLSAEAQPTGLGSGVAKGQSDVREDIRKFDSVLLAATLRDQLFRQYLRVNNRAGGCPTITWGSDTPEELDAVGDLLAKLAQAGLAITDDGIDTLNNRLGFTVQRSGSPIADSPDEPASKKAIALRALAADPDERIVAGGRADLTQAFRSDLAPVRQIIRTSESAEAVEAQVRTLFADWQPGQVETLVAEALQAFVANGAASQPEYHPAG